MNLKMKNKLRYLLLLPVFMLLMNTSFGQNYTNEDINKKLCKTWRLYTFDPDSTGTYFRFDYAYVSMINFIAGGSTIMKYPDTLLHGSWQWDEPNQLLSISTSSDINNSPSKFKLLEMNNKKCILEVPGQTGKGSKIYLKEGEK